MNMTIGCEPVFPTHENIGFNTKIFHTRHQHSRFILEQGKDYDDPRLAGSYTQLAHRQLGRSRAESGLYKMKSLALFRFPRRRLRARDITRGRF
jgi:hypothetical protein